MKKVVHRNSISRILGISLAVLMTFSASVYAQEQTDDAASQETTQETTSDEAAGDPVKGKALFNSNCAACHKLDKKSTGPALAGVGERHDREWLYNWIHNSAAVIKSGDDYANKIFAEYNNTPMTAFPQLSEQEIDHILAYTDAPAPAKDDKDVAGGGQVVVQQSGISNDVILGALALVFALLIAMLFMVNKTLRKFAEANGIDFKKEESEKRLPIWKAFIQNQFLVIVSVVVLLLVSAYFAYGFFMQVGVDQGYMPVQPIHYSHRIHAGDNEIDCKYCHSTARVSKTSGIPALNVCMNCHKNISEVAEETLAEGQEHGVDYNAEIQKLYKAVGWDVNTQSYTGETEPVRWVRVHNLPDFVYFNHSQHVTVAGVECQTCHGPVETMEVMYQYSPLTMGWCVNCHRETDVKMEGNGYYEKIHEQLAKKYGKDKLTIAEMGGLECGKCHY